MSLPDWKTMPADERDALLAKLCAEGFSASAIAAQFENCSRNAIMGKVLRMNDPAVKLKGHAAGNAKNFAKKFAPWTPGEVRLVANMLREGKRSVDIAARFGMSDQTLRNRVRDNPELAKIGFVTRGQILRKAARTRPPQPKPEKPAPVAVASFAGKPRRFEVGFSTDYDYLKSYLADRGIALSMANQRELSISHGVGRPKKVSWTQVYEVVDEFRVAAGLEPILPKRVAA